MFIKLVPKYLITFILTGILILNGFETVLAQTKKEEIIKQSDRNTQNRHYNICDRPVRQWFKQYLVDQSSYVAD